MTLAERKEVIVRCASTIPMGGKVVSAVEQAQYIAGVLPNFMRQTIGQIASWSQGQISNGAQQIFHTISPVVGPPLRTSAKIAAGAVGKIVHTAAVASSLIPQFTIDAAESMAAKITPSSVRGFLMYITGAVHEAVEKKRVLSKPLSDMGKEELLIHDEEKIRNSLSPAEKMLPLLISKVDTHFESKTPVTVITENAAYVKRLSNRNSRRNSAIIFDAVTTHRLHEEGLLDKYGNKTEKGESHLKEGVPLPKLSNSLHRGGIS
ncbi:MAG: hypothetical protein V4568_12340 [Pseudomonadota bacterium]